MTGNDIVDLNTAATESNWKRRGFIEKIFTPAEQHHILHASAPGLAVWRLWTMKESTYKVHIRQTGLRLFAPQKYQCQILDDTRGFVNVDHKQFDTYSTLTKEYIYSSSREKNCHFNRSTDRCFSIPGDADHQAFIRRKILLTYSTVTGENVNNIVIRKHALNIPFIHILGHNTLIPVSITHHGRYAAFTIN